MQGCSIEEVLLLAPEVSSIRGVSKSNTGRGLGWSRTSSGDLGTEHSYWREYGCSSQVSAAFSLVRHQLLGKDSQRWIWFARRQARVQLCLLSHQVLWEEVIGAEWQKVYHSCVFAVLFHYVLQSCWIYTSMFCISHSLDLWRSIAHSNNININSRQLHSCLLRVGSSSMLFLGIPEH